VRALLHDLFMSDSRKDIPKKKVRKDFFGAVVRIASSKHAAVMAKQVAEIQPRILQALRSCSGGSELADGFVATIRYFAAIAYWRGYKVAKRHYETLGSVTHPPHGRERVHLAIERMLEEDLKMSAEEVCKRLDSEKLSESFYPTKGKQKIINVGPRQGKIEHRWVDVYKDPFVKGLISRIRTRLRDERRAEAWMALSQKALSREKNPG